MTGRKTLYYPEVGQVIEIHNTILEIYGGLEGVKDIQQLESLLQHIQNDQYYPLFLDKATHLFFGIIKFHCFNDGNKRTAISILNIFFMFHNIHINDFVTKTEDIAIGVADNKISKENLHLILESMMKSFGYEEKIKNFNTI